MWIKFRLLEELNQYGLKARTESDEQRMQNYLLDDIPLQFEKETLKVFERNNGVYVADLKKFQEEFNTIKSKRKDPTI